MFCRTMQPRTSTSLCLPCSTVGTMTRRIWLWTSLSLGLGLIGGLEPTRASAMQYGGGQPPAPPQQQFPGLSFPGSGVAADPLQGQIPGADPNATLPPGSEVLARGPIHEAFAMPVLYNPVQPLTCPKPPPPLIQETPPDQRPEGSDVEWIPGYWTWEDERQDYIWVSGIWRDIPPGRQWIPGYWSEATGGYGWTAGFWATAEPQGGLDYLPPPPASLENGPNAPCPGSDYAWGPGQWVWQQTQYNWQPGYWYQTRPDWVWNPACYQSTPSGCVYNSGYWDYNLPQRGVAFAPVAFNNPGVEIVAGAPPISYRPSCVLPVGGLMSSLFVRPNYGHYCFGDYYGASTTNVTAGARYIPWFEFRNNRVGYDPLYSTMACQPNRLPNWDRVYREDYHYRVAHPEYRPRPTYAAQQTYFQNHPHPPVALGYGGTAGYGGGAGRPVASGYGGAVSQPPTPGYGGGASHPVKLVETFNQWAGGTNHPHPIVPVHPDHRTEILRRQESMASFQRQRIEQERLGRQAQVHRTDSTNQVIRPLFRNVLPRSPIAAATASRYGNQRPAQAPNHPVSQASYHPQFGTQHHAVPVIHHEQVHGPQMHQEGRRLK